MKALRIAWLCVCISCLSFLLTYLVLEALEYRTNWLGVIGSCLWTFNLVIALRAMAKGGAK